VREFFFARQVKKKKENRGVALLIVDLVFFSSHVAFSIVEREEKKLIVHVELFLLQ
jgi:hypothetical protein